MLALVTSTLSFKAGVTVKAPVAARAQPVMVAAALVGRLLLLPALRLRRWRIRRRCRRCRAR